ncbi:hypothetical protein DMA11_05160 [Marinilabiliaceae bacterium JC017]|nr:hypothetical protein DMA11_05160 [Marinilabiliaceae bacterium JC017]
MKKRLPKQCFVCGKADEENNFTRNKKTNLPVCHECMNSKKEKEVEIKALDSLSEGFICGCIS